MKMHAKIFWIFLVCLVVVIDDTSAGRHHRHGGSRTSRKTSKQRIQGPRSYRDSIAIVGAGAAGVHMAYLLKKKGFRDVTILEKRSRAGGKSLTIDRRGASQELGTCYLSPDYEENIIALMKEFTNDQLAHIPAASIWTDRFRIPIEYGKWVGFKSMMNFNTTNPNVAKYQLLQAIKKYIFLHQQLFGNYTGELMPRPSKKVMHTIRGTFMQYLQRNGLTSLHPLFMASHTMQGYGHVDEIAALYGLMWNTPKLMMGLVRRLHGTLDTGLYMLKNGFQRLWQAIIDKENLHIEYNVDIKNVYRRGRRGSWLCTRFNRDCNFYRFVIWTADLSLNLRTFHPFHQEERDIFTRLEAHYFSTSLIDSLNVRKGPTAIDYMFSNVLQKKEHSVWAQRDSYAALRGYNGTKYQHGLYPTGNDGKKTRTTVGYQYGKSRPTKEKLRRIMKHTLENMNGTNIDIKLTIPWRYFPRFNPDDVTGEIIWDIVDMQGRFGMWYAGHSAIFESVKSVVEYNELLIRKMKAPCV